MTKLTLSVDEGVVERAKRYAARRRTSVSRLVEQYLDLLSGSKSRGEEPLPPVLSRIRAALKGASVEVTDYHRYLQRKYR